MGHKYIPDEQKENVTSLDPVNGWDTFTRWLAKPPKKAKTVVVDTISGLYELCFHATCAKNNWKHPSDGAHGKGWSEVKRAMFDALGRLTHICASMNATLIFIDHSKIETIETATSNLEKITCAMPGQARNIVLPIPDHIWLLGYDSSDAKDSLHATTAKRCLYVGGNAAVEAGCRDPKVRVKVITPLSKNKPYEQIVKELYAKEKDNE